MGVVHHLDCGLVLLAVVGRAGGGELDGGVGHGLPGDVHFAGQLCARHVIVVAVALHPVPNLVVPRVGAGGEAGGIVGAVHRVLQSAACHGPRCRNQRLG